MRRSAVDLGLWPAAHQGDRPENGPLETTGRVELSTGDRHRHPVQFQRRLCVRNRAGALVKLHHEHQVHRTVEYHRHLEPAPQRMSRARHCRRTTIWRERNLAPLTGGAMDRDMKPTLPACYARVFLDKPCVLLPILKWREDRPGALPCLRPPPV